MSDSTLEIQRISQAKRKDPLIDLKALNDIAKLATKTARNRAVKNGTSYTIAQHGKVYRVHPNGDKELVRNVALNGEFTRIEDDLCQA